MSIKSLYIAPQRERSGTVIVTLGIMERLKSHLGRVAFFAPIIRDYRDTELYINYFNLTMNEDESYGFLASEVEKAIAENRFSEVVEEIIKKFKNLEEKYDFVVCQGVFRTSFSQSLDFDINLEISKNLNTPFIRIINGKDLSVEEIGRELHINHDTITCHGCTPIATFVNRVEPKLLESMKGEFNIDRIGTPAYFLPEIEELDLPTVGNVASHLGCDLISGDPYELRRVVKQSKIAAMTLTNFIEHLEDGDLVIIPGDRADILLATVTANYSSDFPSIAGVLLTGGLMPSDSVIKLLNGITYAKFPIFSTEADTYTTALQVEHVPAKITLNNERKIALAMGLFNQYADLKAIDGYLESAEADIVTPVMFKYKIFETARKNKKNIVLPESEDDRILRAAEILLRRDVVDITLLGNRKTINDRAVTLGLNLDSAAIVDPTESEWREDFSSRFYELRKHKGLHLEDAKDTMTNPLYFATMMVYSGYAGGMVCGASHTTQETIRPALQIIKTKGDISIVSSVFFMCLETKVLVYGDCAVNQDPTAQELAQIAISSADTAASFGITPKIAMLSYSTGSSGKGADVEKVAKATEIVKEQRSDLLVEGPIQYDAAIDMSVAKAKLPGSEVAGQATIFIFPDLNTGNNTYKAVQRSSGAVAIGPVLQGLKKPVNDLSRGCTVEDIVNTVAITAIQAQ